MTITLLFQALIAPLFVIGLAALARGWYPAVIVVGFWVLSLWVKGFTFEAMDSIAMALTLAAVSSVLTTRVSTWQRSLVYAVALIALSVWQVKNFAADLSLFSWLIQFSILALAVVLPELKTTTVRADQPLFNRFDVTALFWLIPIGALAFLSPIAGSIIVGQMSGLIALLLFGVWFLNKHPQQGHKKLAILITVPSLFAAQMAWHYVEIPWTTIAISLLGWLPLLWPGLKKMNVWSQALILVLLFGSILGIQLYLEWPQGSLY
jgi:hypothetical protein